MLRTTLPVLGIVATFVACSSDPDPVDPTDTPDGSSSSSSSSGAPTPDPSDASDAAASQSAYMPAGYTELPFRVAEPVHSFDAAEQVLQPNQDYVAVLETDAGRIVLDLYEVETPNTVNSFVFLALHRFYENVAFHRVIDGFMAQTGDPNTLSDRRNRWGSGGPGYQFGLEVRPDLNFDGPGVLGMARSQSPDSNGSQFFITFEAQPGLDQEYTVWGKVIENSETLPAILRGEPPAEPTRIVRVGIGVKTR